MNPTQKANLEKFIAALKSGKYEQIQGHLVRGTRNNLCFCAEGLACHISGIEVVFNHLGRAVGFVHEDGFRCVTAEREWFKKEFGFDPNMCVQQNRSLVALNDSVGLTFPEIGKILEGLLKEK